MNTRQQAMAILILAATLPLRAQDPPVSQAKEAVPQIEREQLGHYQLGPGDEIIIYALDADELANKPIRVSTSGEINLPLIGRINAAGMTVKALEDEIKNRLKVYIQEPQISVNVVQFRSQPVSVIGHVGTPGVHQLEGRKTLIEVLSMAGGLRGDAGARIKITRKPEWGPIPLPGATTDPNGFSLAEVPLADIIQARHPEWNIRILPHDVITIPRAEIIYVMGQVRKPGGYTLNDKESLSVLQALALAEGLGPTPAEDHSRIIRTSAGTSRQEIPVNLKQILSGKKEDIELRPDDILFVPNSAARGALRTALDSAIRMATGVVIYRRY
jgi:polysaccharide export outer membrane protein